MSILYKLHQLSNSFICPTLCLSVADNAGQTNGTHTGTHKPNNPRSLHHHLHQHRNSNTTNQSFLPTPQRINWLLSVKPAPSQLSVDTQRTSQPYIPEYYTPCNTQVRWHNLPCRHLFSSAASPWTKPVLITERRTVTSCSKWLFRSLGFAV
jgi:hypothetical protein